MRSLGSLLVFAAVALGLYYYSVKKLPGTDQGTAPTQAVSITGLRMDLLQIAHSERLFMAQNGHCASLEELTSSGDMGMSRSEREGYTYTIECDGGDFTVIARHEPASAGSQIRYPVLAIDSSMQVREVN
ncbi:MAG: hypothetical protein PVS2B2_16350 [Candidatus Acidiferrum sp.]